MVDRRALATEAMRMSILARAKAQVDYHGPICIYSVCQKHGVIVRFNSINMEGMYQAGAPPRIHLSARRPLVRRAYNCAHELGHHVFSHGSSIDELRKEAKQKPQEDPKEFVANVFAGFLLMPTIGIRHAFSVRNWKPESSEPVQLYSIASEFGVGYGTLITHLCYGIGAISRPRSTYLLRSTPKDIRAEILGDLSSTSLLVLDTHTSSPTADMEVGAHVLLPGNTQITADALTFERECAGSLLYRAVKPGLVQATCKSSSWAIFIRITRKEYVGLAQYRHLEEDEDE